MKTDSIKFNYDLARKTLDPDQTENDEIILNSLSIIHRGLEDIARLKRAIVQTKLEVGREAYRFESYYEHRVELNKHERFWPKILACSYRVESDINLFRDLYHFRKIIKPAIEGLKFQLHRSGGEFTLNRKNSSPKTVAKIDELLKYARSHLKFVAPYNPDDYIDPSDDPEFDKFLDPYDEEIDFERLTKKKWERIKQKRRKQKEKDLAIEKKDP